MKCTCKFAVIITLIFSANLNAALIDDENHMVDSNTGLIWLDIAATQGMGYYNVYNETQVGGVFDEYRIATEDELKFLLTTYNNNTNLWDFWAVRPNWLVANIFYDNPLHDELATGYGWQASVYHNGLTFMSSSQDSIYNTESHVGVALIKTVPLPATALLLVSGLLVLGGVRIKLIK